MYLVVWVDRQLRSWGLQVELIEGDFETDNSLSLALYADSEDPALDLDARFANSLDENKELVLSASDPEGLDADK